ncbi:MAG TPA: sulfotransferase [Steroidobacteraceae bacterium]|nr:sulfotransferase [Steroidobacteraceae bacterium]
MTGPSPDATYEHRQRAAAVALQSGRARTAEQALRALSAEAPGDLHNRWLLGISLLDQGRIEESIAQFDGVLRDAPDFAHARVDRARACRAAGRTAEAREQVRAVLAQHPHLALAWLAYGDVLVDLQQYDDARIAFERARQCDPERASIEAATAAMLAGDRRAAEELFRQILRRDPGHAAALCGLGALSLAADVPADAERLLRHALRQSAHLPLAWRGLGPALLSLGRLAEAAAAAQYLRTIEPDNPQSWIATAAAATRLLRPEEALAAYERAVQLQPQEVRLRTSIGHVHKTLGRRADCEAAYKEALALDPRHAEAYWSLADLKNYRFSDAEIAAMEQVLGDPRRQRDGDAQLCFALGKAYEQREQYPRAFGYYARGNELRRLDQPFDIGAFEQRAARIRRFFSAEFFAAHAGCGDASAAPIFIVGLPRSGSTLIEQILASHSRVEGTMELPNILNLVRDLSGPGDARGAYPESVAALSRAQFAALGARYLEETAPLRSGKPRFIDKLPNNFSHVGFIHSILPNATVIDARREPMDCCFSLYKQHFAEGQAFSYDLGDLGRYYRSYLATMAHWDAVLPGKVLQVKYEQLVHAPEQQIRRILQHCNLPFEPACLAFHETRRAVRTASAEQVRQPIYRSAIGHWRHFERELEPLRAALGDALLTLPNSD